MSRGLTIGEFAQVAHLSVRTLRRYHESGLLEPASVDPASGYRYYTADQIPAAQVIHRLRELDVPLADVAKILATEDPQERAGLAGGHLRRLEEELNRTRAAVTSLRRLLRPDAGELDVELRAVPSRTVAAVEGVVDQDEVLSWYAEGGGCDLWSCRPPNSLSSSIADRTTTSTSPTVGSAPGWSGTPSPWPVRSRRRTWSVRATIRIRRLGGPRSAGRCSGFRSRRRTARRNRPEGCSPPSAGNERGEALHRSG